MNFRRALQLLTRLPVPVTGEPEADWLARAAKWFPLVGMGVGLVSGGLFFLARLIWPAGPVPAVMALGAAVLITGGLHEDGLADVADGLGAGRDVETRLRIMKDSHIGTYGVLALLLTLAAKIGALSGLTGWQGFGALIAAHGLARAGCTATMAALSYVRPADSSKFGPIGRPSQGEWLFAIVCGVAATLLMPARAIAISLLVASFAGLGMGWLARRKLGGYTGDVLGAVEQTMEVAVLLAASAIMTGAAL